MKSSPKFKIAAGVLGALAIAGVAAWVFQLINGLGVTGMSNGTSWGLYITMFMLFVGLSAGGLIVASSASVFRVAEYKKVALPAVILSTVHLLRGHVHPHRPRRHSARVAHHHRSQPDLAACVGYVRHHHLPDYQHCVPGLHDLEKARRAR